MDDIKHVKFQNIQNPKAKFDMIKLEELYSRRDLDHSIENHHRVHFYILFFVEKGKGIHTVDFTNYSFKKGTVLTIRKDQVHRFNVLPKVKGTLLLFTDEFLVSYLEAIEAQKTILLFNELLGKPKIELSASDFQTVRDCIKRMEKEYFSIRDNHSLGIIRSELHILITQLYRKKSITAAFNLEKKYLKEFISLQKLVEKNASITTRVKDYAGMLGLSTKTLNTITRNIIHKSAKEFVDEVNTNQIKRLLINSQLSIKEIAYQSGFEETTNFFKYFKRQTGHTPEQFREQYL